MSVPTLCGCSPARPSKNGCSFIVYFFGGLAVAAVLLTFADFDDLTDLLDLDLVCWITGGREGWSAALTTGVLTRSLHDA